MDTISLASLIFVADAVNRMPFSYDLHATVKSAKDFDAPVMIACHGYGQDYTVVERLRAFTEIQTHLLGFNFPDYGLTLKTFNADTLAYGSLEEIKPLLHLLKALVCDYGLERVDLYGFELGGEAVINAVACLKSGFFDHELHEMGIGTSERAQIASGVSKGVIVLDCPFKSFEELRKVRPNDKIIKTLAERYQDNCMVPLEQIAFLRGMNLKSYSISKKRMKS